MHKNMSLYPDDENFDRRPLSLPDREQWNILKNSLKVVKKIKAFPRKIPQSDLKIIADKASHAELLFAKNKVQKVALRLRSIQVFITALLIVGMLTFFAPLNVTMMAIIASTLLAASLFLIGIALFVQRTGVFKNAHQILNLSEDFLKPLQYETACSLAPTLPKDARTLNQSSKAPSTVYSKKSHSTETKKNH